MGINLTNVVIYHHKPTPLTYFFEYPYSYTLSGVQSSMVIPDCALFGHSMMVNACNPSASRSERPRSRSPVRGSTGTPVPRTPEPVSSEALNRARDRIQQLTGIPVPRTPEAASCAALSRAPNRVHRPSTHGLF